MQMVLLLGPQDLTDTMVLYRVYGIITEIMMVENYATQSFGKP